MPFFTLEDPNAKVKGSRDPLGLVPIWQPFARHVVANLTSVSTSVRGFTILLLGHYFAARLVTEDTVRRAEVLNVVLRMEQLGAYARHVGHGVEGDIRGIERVKRFLEEGKRRVFIQVDRRGLILSDQKVYGLWGLYSVAARRSGFLPEGQLGVTPVTREFIETHYLPHLNPVLNPLLRLLAKGGTLDARDSNPLFAALVKTLPSNFTRAEVEFYGHHLRDGHSQPKPHSDAESSDGHLAKEYRQARLCRLLDDHANLSKPTGRAEVLQLAEAARPIDEGLSRYLYRIAHLEALLAPAGAVFGYVLANRGQHPKQVAKHLRELWGDLVPNLDPTAFQDLLGEIHQIAYPEVAAPMQQCHTALARGDYESAVRAVIEWNAKVMEHRKGGAWVVYAPDGCLDVRYREMEESMPSAEDLPTLWRNSYFIDALKGIVRQLRNES